MIYVCKRESDEREREREREEPFYVCGGEMEKIIFGDFKMVGRARCLFRNLNPPRKDTVVDTQY